MVDAAYRFARHEPGSEVVLFGTGNRAHLRSNIDSILRPPLPRPMSRSSMPASARCAASGSTCRIGRRGADGSSQARKRGGRLLAGLMAMLAGGAGLTVVLAAEITHIDGYAVDRDVLCGTAPDAYPKLRIGMREGYCAGLVAAKTTA